MSSNSDARRQRGRQFGLRSAAPLAGVFGPVLTACAAPAAEPEPSPEPSSEPAEPSIEALHPDLAVALRSDTPGRWQGPTRTGEQWVRVRSRPASVPLNEPFELAVGVCDPVERERLLPDAQVFVRAWMPAHGHGMNRQPEVVSEPDGSFSVRGMLFHMSGLWEIGVDVIQGGVASSVTFEVELP